MLQLPLSDFVVVVLSMKLREKYDEWISKGQRSGVGFESIGIYEIIQAGEIQKLIFVSFSAEDRKYVPRMTGDPHVFDGTSPVGIQEIAAAIQKRHASSNRPKPSTSRRRSRKVDCQLDFLEGATPTPSLDGAALAYAKAALPYCSNGIPEEVLRKLVGQSEDDLKRELRGFAQRNHLGFWMSLSPSSTHQFPPNVGGLHARKHLKLLMDYTSKREEQEVRVLQVNTALHLAQLCLHDFPDDVAGIFSAVEKALKAYGNKRVVLEAAKLTVRATNHENIPERSATGIVEAEAKARVCGYAWVYQRTDRLDEAEREIDESFRLGDLRDDHRNSAFCQKCKGRLQRFRAERENDPKRRIQFLNESIDLLKDALDRFARLGQQGRDELSDCYCLLGRTYWVCGDHVEASRMALKASDLSSDTGKDILDLLILKADLEPSESEACRLYEAAIKGCLAFGNEGSEIKARALLHRGRKRSLTAPLVARIDFLEAAELSKSMDDEFSEAEARWECLQIDEQIPEQLLARLQAETYPIRMRGYRIISKRRYGAVVGNREANEDAHWLRAIDEAKREYQISRKSW